MRTGVIAVPAVVAVAMTAMEMPWAARTTMMISHRVDKSLLLGGRHAGFRSQRQRGGCAGSGKGDGGGQ